MKHRNACHILEKELQDREKIHKKYKRSHSVRFKTLK